MDQFGHKGFQLSGGVPHRSGPETPPKGWRGAQAKRRMTHHYFSLGKKIYDVNPGPGRYERKQMTQIPQTSRVAIIHRAPPPIVSHGSRTHRDHMSDSGMTPRAPAINNVSEDPDAAPVPTLVHTTGAIYHPFDTNLHTPGPTAYNPVLPSMVRGGIIGGKSHRGIETKNVDGSSLYTKTTLPGPATYFPRLDFSGMAGRDRTGRRKYTEGKDFLRGVPLGV